MHLVVFWPFLLQIQRVLNEAPRGIVKYPLYRGLQIPKGLLNKTPLYKSPTQRVISKVLQGFVYKWIHIHTFWSFSYRYWKCFMKLQVLPAYIHTYMHFGLFPYGYCVVLHRDPKGFAKLLFTGAS